MEIKEFDNKFKSRDEIWVVADGPTCPEVTAPLDGTPVLSVNYGFMNCVERPYGLVYVDRYFRRKFAGYRMDNVSDYIFYAQETGHLKFEKAVPFRRVLKRTSRLQDGVYTGMRPDGQSAGVAALQIAIGMRPKMIRLFGYDYRIFTEEEAMNLFGKKLGVHKSESNHRRTDVMDKKTKLNYLSKIKSFDAFLHEGVQIINHSIHSNLNQFPKMEWRT